jgi:pimeloyl-ACP methyl ester carboxylesterase
MVASSPPPRQFLRWFAHGLGPGEAMAQRMQDGIEQQEGVPMQQFEAAWLGPRLKQPTLLLHDREDRVAPLAAAQALAAALQQSELVLSEGLGHRRILDDPASLQRLTQFVGAHQD